MTKRKRKNLMEEGNKKFRGQDSESQQPVALPYSSPAPFKKMTKRKREKLTEKANKKFRGQESEQPVPVPVVDMNLLRGSTKKNKKTETPTSSIPNHPSDSSLMYCEDLSDSESTSDKESTSKALKRMMENLDLNTRDTFDSDDQSVHNVPERRRSKRLYKSTNSSRHAEIYRNYVKDYPKNLLQAIENGNTSSKHGHISAAALRTRTWCSGLQSDDVGKEFDDGPRKSRLRYQKGSPETDLNVIMVEETPPGSPTASDVGFTFTFPRNEAMPIRPKKESYYRKILSNDNIWSDVKLRKFLAKHLASVKLSRAQLKKLDASTLNRQLEELLDQLLGGEEGKYMFTFNELEVVLQDAGLIGHQKGSLLHSFMKSFAPRKCQTAMYLLAEPKPGQQ